MSMPKLPLLPANPSGEGIPPILHRIWVGPTDDIPEWVWESWIRWEEFLRDSEHEWTTVTWTNQTIKGRPVERAKVIADAYGLPPRGLADLIRVISVSLRGGFYMDADVVPLRSLDDLVNNPEVPLWTTSHAASREQGVLWNGGWGAEKGSPYLAQILDNAQRGLARGVKNEHFLAGPRAYREFLPEDALTEWDFQFESSAAERRTMGAGGDFDYDELRAKYPARLKHIGPTFEEAS